MPSRFVGVMASAVFLLACCIVLCTGCAHGRKGDVVAVVGEDSITDKAVKAYMSASPTTIDRDDALRRLVQDSILFQEARRLGYDRLPAVQERIDTLIRQTVTSVFVHDRFSKDSTITEETARGLYDSNWNNIRFPRWVGVFMVEIHYQKDEGIAGVMEYARTVRERFMAPDFDRSSEESLKTLQKEMPAPDGASVKMRHQKKIFLSNFRLMKTDIERVAESLREGQMNEPAVIGHLRTVGLIGITREYPREEIAFEKVRNELMLGAADALKAEQMMEYVDSVKERYNIRYLK